MICEIKNPLDYNMDGANTLREAIERDCRKRYGNNIYVHFYYTIPNVEPSKWLLLGEPQPMLMVNVIKVTPTE